MMFTRPQLRAVALLSCSIFGMLMPPFQSIASCQGARILALRSTLRLDGEQLDLSNVADLAMDARGRIAVVMNGEGRVRVFLPTGVEGAALGREGGGPGEFRSPVGLGWKGDSLWVFDRTLRRLTLFDPDMGLVRSFQWPLTTTLARTGESVSQLTPVGFDERGNLLSSGMARGGLQPGSRVVYLRHDESARDGSLIADRPSSERCMSTLPTGQLVLRPFCTKVFTDFAPTGIGVAIVVPQEGEPGVVVDFHRSGVGAGRGFHVVLPVRAAPLTATEIDSVVARVATSMKFTDAQRTQFRSQVTADRTQPMVASIVTGSDASVWLGNWGGVPGRYLWLSPSGGIRGVAVLGSDERIMTSTGSAIVTLRENANGFALISRYTVQ